MAVVAGERPPLLCSTHKQGTCYFPSSAEAGSYCTCMYTAHRASALTPSPRSSPSSPPPLPPKTAPSMSPSSCRPPPSSAASPATWTMESARSSMPVLCPSSLASSAIPVRRLWMQTRPSARSRTRSSGTRPRSSSTSTRGARRGRTPRGSSSPEPRRPPAHKSLRTVAFHLPLFRLHLCSPTLHPHLRLVPATCGHAAAPRPAAPLPPAPLSRSPRRTSASVSTFSQRLSKSSRRTSAAASGLADSRRCCRAPRRCSPKPQQPTALWNRPHHRLSHRTATPSTLLSSPVHR